MKLASRLEKLGTETAFAVSATAARRAAKGHKIYPFHLGDLNTSTPKSIVKPTIKAIDDGYTGYCPCAAIPELRDVIAGDVGKDAAVTGLYAIDDISLCAVDSAFYVFPNVTSRLQRKGIDDISQLMNEALVETNVSFCTRKHFGRPLKNEANDYIRFAHSGIGVDDIREGLSGLKEYLDR